MKALKWTGYSLATLLGIYVLFVVLFEGVYLGAMQPSFEENGIPMLLLITHDEDGETQERMLARFETDDNLYVSAHHWPRSWFGRLVREPKVEVEIDGLRADYIAVSVEGEEFNRVANRFPMPFVVRFMMGFPPKRDIARLDPVEPMESA